MALAWQPVRDENFADRKRGQNQYCPATKVGLGVELQVVDSSYVH